MFKEQKKSLGIWARARFLSTFFDVLVRHLIIWVCIRRTQMKVLGFEEE